MNGDRIGGCGGAIGAFHLLYPAKGGEEMQGDRGEVGGEPHPSRYFRMAWFDWD